MKVQITKRAGTIRVAPGSGGVSTRLKSTLGIPGPANVLSIGSVTTLDPSEGADANITGTSPTQILNLDIPRGYTGATTIGDSGMAFETRAAIAGATIEAVRKYAHTAGYAAFGDNGHGLYKRMAAAPSDPSNRAYVRSIDRFRADGTTDATHGGYWQLVPEGHEVLIEQFGGAGNSSKTGVGGTDNWQAVIDALAFVQWEWFDDQVEYGLTIRFGSGNYRSSAGFSVDTIFHMTGVPGSGQYRSPTTLHFPNTVDPFIFQTHNTTGATGTTGGLDPTSNGSVFENFTIYGGGRVGLASARVGIRVRSQMMLRNLSLYEMPGKGIAIVASTGNGNANNWRASNIHIHEPGGDFFFVSGNETNAGICVGLVTHGTAGVGGCGIRDESGLGSNTYISPQITGYGNQGVHRGGRLYRLIDTTAGIGASTTPGTNDLVWYDIGAGSASGTFPEWSGSDTHYAQIPIYCSGANTTFIAPYVEGSGPGHGAGGVIAVGGVAGWTRYTSHLESLDNGLVSAKGVGGRQTYESGQEGFTYNGAQTYAIAGARLTSAEPNKGLGILIFRRSIDAEADWVLRYYDKDIICTFGSGNRYVFDITTTSSVRTFGRSAAVPYMMSLHDFGLVDPGNFNNNRIFGLRNGAAPSSGNQAAGEYYFNMDASVPEVGYYCSVTGTPGTYQKVYGRALQASETHDPANLAAGAVDAIQTIAVAGAALGDLVSASFSINLQGVALNAWVSATDVVSYQFVNPAGAAGAIDLGSGTVKVRVWK